MHQKHVDVKGKVSPVNATETLGGGGSDGGLALHILNE